MRKLMLFALGFGLSCGLCAYVIPAGWIIRIAVFTFLLSGMLFFLNRDLKGLNYAALVFAGCTLGFLWYGGFRYHVLGPAQQLDGQTMTVTVRTSDYSEETAYGVSAEGTLRLNERNYTVQLYLNSREQLPPATVITGPFRFVFTAPQDDPDFRYIGKGIFLLAYQQDDVVIRPAEEDNWIERIGVFRRNIRSVIQNIFPEDVYPFAQALLLGDTSSLNYETDTDFKISGIRHVVAVSGLHVGILVALLSTLTFRRKLLMIPLGITGLVLFAALAGFTPSVVRACIMYGLLLLSQLFNREYDGATALSFAALVMLLQNPLAITSVSFQLSVASVAGIFLFSEKISNWILRSLNADKMGKRLGKLMKGFALSVSVTLGATVMTAPLCAWYFGMVSLVSVITNLLVLWIISGIFYGIMVLCLLYFLWPAAAVAMSAIVVWPVRYVLAVAGFMADIPLAAVYTDSVYIVFWLIFVYVLLTVFYIGRAANKAQLICCTVLGLCLALMASWLDNPWKRTDVTLLDVGQGQCILLQSGGKTYMVDCGGTTDTHAADTASEYLLSRGIRRLDGIILTHLDEDHAGAVEELLTRVETELMILPPVYSTLSGETTLYASENLRLQSGDTSLTVFSAPYPGTDNEKSLCVLFETENCVILITGDRDGFGERMLLRNEDIPEVDILIAGHHGSNSSTCEELLSALQPEIVCISAGRNNPFGHPAPALLERLDRYGCTVYRTDQQGTITIRR